MTELKRPETRAKLEFLASPGSRPLSVLVQLSAQPFFPFFKEDGGGGGGEVAIYAWFTYSPRAELSPPVAAWK